MSSNNLFLLIFDDFPVVLQRHSDHLLAILRRRSTHLLGHLPMRFQSPLVVLRQSFDQLPLILEDVLTTSQPFYDDLLVILRSHSGRPMTFSGGLLAIH
ncbi:unnamed protein product [Ilex paraguariensis]|uniref:Uncharacterized protein n=1 Tax=Ilex paraguariensis TaxID=185542 RepID=A0ABC8V361_9AQUA